MALGWFEPNLLLADISDPSELHPLWMENSQEFVLELRTNFGPHDPVGDAEHELCHLSLKDGQHVTKYVVEFNRLACQLRGYGDGALQHIFYSGVSDRIKDEISRVGRLCTLSDMHTLAQTIDARYWECRSELNRQTSSTSTSTPIISTPTLSSMMLSNSIPTCDSTSDPNSDSGHPDIASDTHSLNSDESDESPPNDAETPYELGPDGKLSVVKHQRHFDLNLCLFCGLTGHKVRDCPKSSQS
jgi:hypothetical protein